MKSFLFSNLDTMLGRPLLEGMWLQMQRGTLPNTCYAWLGSIILRLLC